MHPSWIYSGLVIFLNMELYYIHSVLFTILLIFIHYPQLKYIVFTFVYWIENFLKIMSLIIFFSWFSPFYFKGFGSSLRSLLWILFQVDCLFPLHLFGLVVFYLAPSSAAYFSVFSFCLSYCVWGLHFTGCRFVVPVVFGVCPQWLRLVQWVV